MTGHLKKGPIVYYSLIKNVCVKPISKHAERQRKYQKTQSQHFIRRL